MVRETQENSDLSSLVRQARVREGEAWARLQHTTEPISSELRRALLERWLECQRTLRQVEQQVTAIAVFAATQSLRDCAQLLSKLPPIGSLVTSPATAGARLETSHAPPHPPIPGQVWQGNDGTAWEVVAIVHDDLEEGLFLAQLQRAGAASEPVDVYSDDWPLFCVLQGLRQPA